MKTLIVVRHAKSSWGTPGMADHDRPLNKRGNKDAPEMAERLREKVAGIDLFLSSTATRARTTARYFANAYKKDKKEIVLEEKLYAAAPQQFYQVLATLPDRYATVALFSHNPGITGFVNTLGLAQVDELPTCAVYAVTADTKKWASFEIAGKGLLFFDYPKNG